MDRREFLSGMGGLLAAASSGSVRGEGPAAPEAPRPAGSATDPFPKLNVKPVLTNIVHTGMWEGPCRWSAVPPAQEKANAEGSFAGWSKDLKEKGLYGAPEVNLLEPAHITFSEDFRTEGALAALESDAASADAYFVLPAGSSISAFEIADRFRKPILLVGLGCRNVDIAAYTRARGQEAYVAADGAEMRKILATLRARKAFRSTRALFPTDRGLPAVCSVGSVWDLADLEARLGVAVKVIPYRELAEEMDRVLGDRAEAETCAAAAEDLVKRADRSFIDAKHVARSFQLHRAVRNLMDRHGCNGFTIECFEFCSSRLPDRWMITPCLVHGLLKNRGMPSSCEADIGSLLALHMLTLVSGRSCHQGNSDPLDARTFRINHSNPSLKMDGLDRPDVPYQLGRFVSGGWGTKLVVDFAKGRVKEVTVARVNPRATKVLVLKGKLAGSSGWDQDSIGCSVEAVIAPPEGRTEEFLRRRLEYGNHLQWVYGDWTGEMRRLGEALGLEVEVIA
jgi:hypothetical protein